MAKVTAEQFTEKWASRLKGSSTQMRQGVERLTVSPTEKAARAKDRWVAGITDAASNGKWERGLRAVSLDEWRSQYINKGIGRVAMGADGAKAKVEAFATQLLTHVDKGQADLDKLPNVTFEDRINRMVAFSRHMATFKR